MIMFTSLAIDKPVHTFDPTRALIACACQQLAVNNIYLYQYKDKPLISAIFQFHNGHLLHEPMHSLLVYIMKIRLLNAQLDVCNAPTDQIRTSDH